jgi:hypothetical protein
MTRYLAVINRSACLLFVRSSRKTRNQLLPSDLSTGQIKHCVIKTNRLTRVSEH